MEVLSIKLRNCYGIQSLDYKFDFKIKKTEKKAFAIYAPNGLMKTSFTRTFEKLSQGKNAEEERYNRTSVAEILVEGSQIPKQAIYVLKSEIDIQEDSPAITDILVNPEHKSRYDAILVDLEKQKIKLIGALQKTSGTPKKDIERTLTEDIGLPVFSDCIEMLNQRTSTISGPQFTYSTIFDPKAIEVLESKEFISDAKEFNNRYQELFSQEGTIYQKGIFNPAKAEVSFTTLDKQGFFNGGHRLQLRGDVDSIGKNELDERLKKIHSRIDEDEKLKKLRSHLAKNIQTQALTELIENLPITDVDDLLERVKSENRREFRIDLWTYYVQNSQETNSYLELFEQTRDEVSQIESEAAKAAPRWTKAVTLFNDRFVDMPFSLSVANQARAALGKEKAKLRFTFKDGEDKVEWSRSEIKTLSQGEKRALYLLNFIFEVEARAQSGEVTLFIIDDVADSFDYKNKHAIIQYLEDLTCNPNFYQIILTHNFDFFRSLSNNFVNRDKCLMANRNIDSVSLSKADGVKNYFIGILKEKINKNPRIMCATIPFTRNLIEYIKSEDDEDYKQLTCLLHWKENTQSITLAEYFDIYNRLFGTTHVGSEVPIYNILHEQAHLIANEPNQAGLNLEDKVLLSIATRMRTEEFLIRKIRLICNDENYWCTSKNQFGYLIKKYTELEPLSPSLRTLEKVSITVSSNIHLNSFMYEPILDLTIDHLINLYNEVEQLSLDMQT